MTEIVSLLTANLVDCDIFFGELFCKLFSSLYVMKNTMQKMVSEITVEFDNKCYRLPVSGFIILLHKI